MAGTFFGMRAIATIHSLPYAMLMWGWVERYSLTTGLAGLMIIWLLTRMIFFAISFLYNVFKSTTMAMLASIVSGSVVVTVSMLWFIWAAREVHIFTRLAMLAARFIVGDVQH